MKHFRKICSALAMGLLATSSLGAENDFVVDTKKAGAEIQPTMYGIFLKT